MGRLHPLARLLIRAGGALAVLLLLAVPLSLATGDDGQGRRVTWNSDEARGVYVLSGPGAELLP